MDHMRISGTEPSSVILRQTEKFQKLKEQRHFDQTGRRTTIYSQELTNAS